MTIAGSFQEFGLERNQHSITVCRACYVNQREKRNIYYEASLRGAVGAARLLKNIGRIFSRSAANDVGRRQHFFYPLKLRPLPLPCPLPRSPFQYRPSLSTLPSLPRHLRREKPVTVTRLDNTQVSNFYKTENTASRNNNSQVRTKLDDFYLASSFPLIRRRKEPTLSRTFFLYNRNCLAASVCCRRCAFSAGSSCLPSCIFPAF